MARNIYYFFINSEKSSGGGAGGGGGWGSRLVNDEAFKTAILGMVGYLGCQYLPFLDRNSRFIQEHYKKMEDGLEAISSTIDNTDIVKAITLVGTNLKRHTDCQPTDWLLLTPLQEESQHGELKAKFFEDGYQKLYEPLHSKRFEVVNGVVEAEGLVNETPVDQKEDDKEKDVPGYWVNAMKTNEILAGEVSEKDEEALKYLKDIKWCRIDDTKGFKIEFFFDSNPFFKNTVLTKTYHMIDEDEPILGKALGTEIEWLPGRCLTQKILQKKPKKGNAKTITRTEKCDSFFHFFNPPQLPEDNEDIAEELQYLMEQDYDIGSAIRDKIIPHAVSWFTGAAAEENDFDDLEEGDCDEDKDKGKVGKKKSGEASAGEGPQGERPPECKQQ